MDLIEIDIENIKRMCFSTRKEPSFGKRYRTYGNLNSLL